MNQAMNRTEARVDHPELPGTAAPSRATCLRWPIIVTCMLLFHVGAMMLAVKIARSDTSHGINGYQILPETGDHTVPFHRAPAPAPRTDVSRPRR